MRCPECVRLDEQSALYPPSSWTSTAMGGSKHYYDEEGVEHRHEVNRSHGTGRCSKGHVIDWALSTKCPAEGCDYGSPQEITVRIDDQRL